MRDAAIFRFVTLGLAGWVACGGALAQSDPLDVQPAPALKLSGRLAQGALAPCPGWSADHRLDARTVVDLALCQHPQTREIWANARYQAALLGVAKGAWFPRLEGSLARNRVILEGEGENQQLARLTLSWLLFDAGRRQAEENSAAALLDAALATRHAVLQSLIGSALQAFYAAQAAEAAVDAAQQAETAAREALQAAEVRYSVGSGTPADRLQAQTAWSQAVLNRVRAEGALRTAYGTLANALGLPAQQALALAPGEEPATGTTLLAPVEALIERARARRPDLQAAEAQWRAAQASVSAAAALGRPSVTLAAIPSWQRQGGLATEGGTLGVTVNVPLFLGYDTLYRVQAANAQADARAAQRDRLTQQVNLEVWRAYHALRTAHEALSASAALEASAGQAQAVALGRYKAGVGSMLDLLNAQAAQASARAQRIQTLYDWRIAKTTLAQAIGALDDLPDNLSGEEAR